MPPAVQTVGAAQTHEQLIASFTVPFKGVMQGTNEITIPPDALWIGENLHFFEGELRQRPSWNLRRDTTLATVPAAVGTVTGLFTGHRATTRNQFLFAGGTAQVYVLSDSTGNWLSLTAWSATRARNAQVRFTELAVGTPLVTSVVYCNGVDVPQRFILTAASGAFAASAGLTIPNDARFKDVCTVADRIVGITDTEAYWSQNLSFTFPATAVKSFAESLDLCIACRPIGTLNVGVWKERSFWIGLARGGSDASFFAWRLGKFIDGPVSPNALTVDSTGNWYWMTRLGRVIKMTTDFEVQYPADGIWPIVRKEINSAYAGYSVSHAVYRPFLDEVWFFYNRSGTTGVPVDRAIVVCHASTPQPAAFIATFSDGSGFDVPASGRVSENMLTAAANNYNDEVVVVNYNSTTVPVQNTIFLPQELQSTGGGGGTGSDFFTVLVQTGLEAARGYLSQKTFRVGVGDTHRLESAELFLRRGAGVHPGTATLNLSGISSSVLDVQAGTIATAVAIPGLNGTAPIKAVTGLIATGRYFGFKVTGDNQNSVFRYLGALLRGRRLV